MTYNSYRFSILLFVRLGKGSSQIGRYLEHGKEFTADFCTINLAGTVTLNQLEQGRGISRKILKYLFLFSPIQKIRIGKGGCLTLLDNDQVV